MKKDFDVEDLYNPLKNDRSTLLGDKLERNWDKQKLKPKGKPSLLRAVAITYWYEYLRLGFLTLIGDVFIRVSQPYVLGLLLTYYNPDSKTTKEQALGYAGMIVTFNTLTSFIKNQYMMNSMHAGMRVRTSVCALIYRKAIKLSTTALGKSSVGKIVNLLSNDVSRFDSASMLLHQMWVGPVSAIIIMYIIFQDIGWSGATGVVTIVTIMPMQAYIGKLSAKYRRIIAGKTDERIRLMNEVIGGIQVIKMYAWEIPFTKLISLARKAEINVIRRSAYIRGVFMAFNLFNNRFALFATLATMVFTNKAITAARVYVFMSYYQILANTLAGVFVNGLTQIAELLVSINRIEEFLENEEHKELPALKRSVISNVNEEMVACKNMVASWNENSLDPVLKNLNFKLGKNTLLGVIGPVGSGKSSLLQSILGELDIVDGSLAVHGTLSYASQEPWIFSGSIRQNILFGSDFDKARYDEVLKVCELRKDFDQFPDRDFTLIGEKGANLSGGQKARINLARAIYKDADIYLLDDPLSAVDSIVSKVLYEDCINGFLAKKARILVTHQVYYLKTADHILVLNNGGIEIEGTYSELLKSDNPLTVHLTEEIEEILKRQKSQDSAIEEQEAKTMSTMDLSKMNGKMKAIVKEMQEETSKGKVKGSLFLEFFKSGMSICEIIFLVTLLTIAQASATVIDWFISFWTNIEEYQMTLNSTAANVLNSTVVDALNSTAVDAINSTAVDVLNSTTVNALNSTVVDESVPFYMNWSSQTCLIIYGAILVFCLVTTLSRSLSFYRFILNCSENLHGMLFTGVTNTYMRFFDKNPSGRILNRFSKDIGSVDEILPRMLFEASRVTLKMLGHLVLVLYVNPASVIVVIILGILFSFIRIVYLRSSNNIKRLEGRMKSPVFSHLTATLEGLTTIRAFKAQNILRAEFDKHQDSHTSAWFMFISTSSAFGFSLDVICLMFIGSLTFSLIGLGEYFNLTGGDVGLAINQASSLTQNIQFLVRFSADISNQLMSVERILEYKELIPEQQPEKLLLPPKSWPDKGIVNIEHLNMKYIDDGPTILKDVSVKINPKEKIGIVGRTGAGKSSLISAIFRLTPLEGKIYIDDINTKDITLKQLRSKVSIIPQDPILFSGTLRYNLDPFDEYSDETLYRALNEVELKDPSNIINRLENRVMDRGSNYSVGQRQLICLARAIIRNNKILVLDEATANVDPQTDALIQRTIREKFADCTVLTVAHRLNTIIDNDRILVLEAGEIVEFDHPYLLLQNKFGVFRKMVEETGTAMLRQFLETSSQNYQKLID
ncbi:ATP-binding cassette sub-family C member 4 isoform X2 [Diabrotica virgifera virgifera]|nr:ATP-binding cassette sub-family C member 4 isoform X2 [Diabrotica virgifera virgifera]KAI2473971.1 ATP binding cassette (ABC) transporter subfamily C member [Diabrotica virgifera virgifera]